MDASPGQVAWPSSIPDLTTERLRLRAPLPRDAADLLALIGDPEVTRYINVVTITTLTEAQACVERLNQRYAARDTIRWAIELLERGEMIGTVGLLRFEAGVLPENAASVRVLQKLGFVEEGTRRDYLYAKGRFHSFRWFSLLATDGAPARGHAG